VRSVLDPVGIDYEIMVVDDDSRDGTEEIVSPSPIEDPRVRLLVRKGERGLSGAVLHGWRHTDAAILGVMDADLQHPPELLPAFDLRHFLRATTWRSAAATPQGGEAGQHGIRSESGSPPLAVWATWPIQRPGIRAKDPMTGFFLFVASALMELTFQPSGFKLLLEILVRGRIRSVAEVPLAFGSRSIAGRKQSQLQSGLGLRQAAC
jgi:dolichol-phosphate mannosyltransferase